MIGVVLLFVQLNAQVVISEIMYNPEEDESLNEFIEIVNISTIDTVDLSNWIIRDKSGTDYLEGATENMKLIPGGYGIIFGSGYSYFDGIYNELIPETTLLLHVDDTRIGNGLGNESDSLYIFSSDGVQITSMEYFNTVREGYSLEKIRLDDGNNLSNWSESLDSLGTPGDINSITPLDIDVCIESDSISHSPLYPKIHDEIVFEIPIVNVGLRPTSGRISILFQNDLIIEEPFNELIPGESIVKSMLIEVPKHGDLTLMISLSVVDDMNVENNSVSYLINVSHPPGTIKINEFLCIPESNQSEFVELISFDEVHMNGWTIRDKSTIKELPEIFVTKDQFIVIASDSGFQDQTEPNALFVVPIDGFPSLNNDGDKIMIYDKTGVCIDSLYYSTDWFIHSGRSTEKYRPEYDSADSTRWGVAIGVPPITPGKENSLYYDQIPKKGSIQYFPNPFSPDGDGFDDILNILCCFPYEQAIVKVEIFDMAGRNIATPYWNQYVSQEILLLWDGYQKNRIPAKIGMYLVKTTARDVYSGKTWEDIQTIVLAKEL